MLDFYPVQTELLTSYGARISGRTPFAWVYYQWRPLHANNHFLVSISVSYQLLFVDKSCTLQHSRSLFKLSRLHQGVHFHRSKTMKSFLISVSTILAEIVIIMACLKEAVAVPRKRIVNKQGDQYEIIEGDMLMTDKLRRILNADKSRSKRDIVSDMIMRWPDGVVPYTLDASLSKKALISIRKAMHEFHKRSCVKFVPRTNEQDYIEFEGNLGCFSAIGRQGGKQRISVGEGCEFKGTVMHEIMHALGFFHEQSRTDRDDYVMVLWWNVEPGFEKNFDSYGPDRLDSAEEPYDYDSLMHYDNLAFSKNGENTLQAISDPDRHLGNMDDFSAIDIKQLLKHYPCKAWDKKAVANSGQKILREEAAKCEDIFENECKHFASHDGYCDYWKKYMTKWCPDSCGFCKHNSPDKRLNIWRGENHTK